MFIIPTRPTTVKLARILMHVWAGFLTPVKTARPAARALTPPLIRLAVPPRNCFDIPRKAEGGAGAPSHGHVRKTVIGSAARLAIGGMNDEHQSRRTWPHEGMSR